jgi:hypothetical protein
MTERFLIEGDDSTRAVGVSHYQDELRAIAGQGDVRHETVALLVREPDNPHDPGAIAVRIDDHTVGYLSRDENVRWRDVVEAIEAHGHSAAAEAVVAGRADTFLGVFLRLPTPTEARAQVGIRFKR